MSARKGGGRNGMHSTVKYPFRVMATLAFSNTNSTSVFGALDLTLANLGVRAVAAGSTFEFFRLDRLSIDSVTDVVASDGTNGLLSGHMAHAFVESNATTSGTPTTEAQMTQYEIFQRGGPYDRLHSRVPKRLLRENPLKWFQCASTGASTDSLSAGVVRLTAHTQLSAGTTAVTMWVIVEGVVEFCGAITPALSYERYTGPKLVVSSSKCELEDTDDESVDCFLAGGGSETYRAIAKNTEVVRRRESGATKQALVQAIRDLSDKEQKFIADMRATSMNPTPVPK